MDDCTYLKRECREGMFSVWYPKRFCGFCPEIEIVYLRRRTLFLSTRPRASLEPRHPFARGIRTKPTTNKACISPTYVRTVTRLINAELTVVKLVGTFLYVMPPRVPTVNDLRVCVCSPRESLINAPSKG